MEQEILDKYLQAGKIASFVREESRNLAKDGNSLLELANKLEQLIKDKGGFPACPVCLSINDSAAHYTPLSIDETKLKLGDYLKVDLGVHVDGYIADTALTICIGKEDDEIIKASRLALENAIKTLKPGVLLKDTSSAIEDAIKSFGLKPISNLTGHGLDQFTLHKDPAIMNVRHSSTEIYKKDQVIAIEPFATNGAGRIKESEPIGIFMQVSEAPVRNQDSKLMLEYIQNFFGLPFAERWLTSKEALDFGLPESLFKNRLALRELRMRGILYDYPTLKEVNSGLVAQTEHTIIIKDEPIVTTL